MRRLTQPIWRFVASEEALTSTEYAVMLALIICLCMGPVQTLGCSARQSFEQVCSLCPLGRGVVGRERHEGECVGRRQGRRFGYLAVAGLGRAAAARDRKAESRQEHCERRNRAASHHAYRIARFGQLLEGILVAGRKRQSPAATPSSGIRLASAIASAAGFASLSRFGRGMPSAIQRSISWNSSSIRTAESTFLRTRPCA